MMRIRTAGVAVLALALTTGCGAVGGSTSQNEWTLIGTTPDQQHLLITTLFGGVASDCTRWEGWEINETPEQVEVKAQVWRKRFPSGCTDEGIIKTIDVGLAEPLGDRQLVGCGTDDCLTRKPQPWMSSNTAIAATPGAGVVVAGDYQITGVDPGGEIRWQEQSWPNSLAGVTGDVVVTSDGRHAVGRNPSTGDELWSDEGAQAVVGDDAVLMCRGSDAESVAFLDGATGVEAWTADTPCEMVVVGSDVVTIIGRDPDIDGGSELVLLDATTGDLVLSRAIDDGIDDQVEGFDGAIAAGDRVVVGGQQADLVVLGPGGEELLRRPSGLGTPIGYAGGAIIVASPLRVTAIDPDTGESIWVSGDLNQSTVTVSGNAIWALDPAAGVVARLDPQTGNRVWTAPVGLSYSFAVAADDTTAYVATALAVVALDANTGEQLWWQHIPYEQPDGE
ncbi:MAG: PQQ-binding-like beta-propeller repeat protein [Acidimicrobiia bacterium]